MEQTTIEQGDEFWEALLEKSASELAGAISLGSHTTTGHPSELPLGRLGAFIPLVGEVKLQLIVLSTNSGVRAMAEALLCHGDGDDPLTRDDISDAICELANQFAGVAKRELGKSVGQLRLGLPVFVRGQIEGSRGSKIRVLEGKWGTVDVTLGLIIAASSSNHD